MPQFHYEVKKGPDEALSGVLEADSRRAAVVRLRDMGYVPITVEEHVPEEDRDVLRRTLRRITLKERNVFFRQLANLFESGMSLTRALLTLEEQTENPKLIAVIHQLREDLQQGNTFAEALEKHADLFTPLQVSLVHAGETGGMLDDVLWRIVAFGEQEEELRGKALSAMVYPAFLMLMGGIAVFILMSFVFPRFSEVFEGFEASLPLITKVVLAICGFMGDWWWAILAALVASVFGAIRYWRSGSGRLQVDTLLLRIPVVRTVVQKMVMAQFARMLGTLLDNGVPVLRSLRIVVDTLTNKAVASDIALIEARVSEGDSISSGLKQSQYFPPMVVNMFAVGEEGGRIGTVAKRLADAYDIEVDRAVKAATALIEPIIIVIMGIIVGTLVIAMLLPMLTMSAMAI